MARIRAGSPGAILAIIPHLLGFRPESSLVVIGTEPPAGTVRVTIRYDLPDPPDRELAAEIADHAVAVLGSQRLTALTAVGYGPDELVTPVAETLRAVAREAGVAVRECLRSHDGHYWSYTCTRPGCCPADGTPFDPAGHPAAAVMAGPGDPVLAGREALAKSIAPLGGIVAQSMRAATKRADDRVVQIIRKVRRSPRVGAARQMIATEGLAAVASMIALYRAGGRYRTDYEMAWLSVALKDLRVRDDAWARMDPRHLAAHRRLWTDLVRRAQPGHVAGPAALLAFVAWQSGDGALANVALDRALADDPDYSMACLLRQVIAAGAPPSLARLPLTPEEVAACYEDQDAAESEDHEAGEDEAADADDPEVEDPL